MLVGDLVCGMLTSSFVGCGFNVLNALPTTSLSQLHSLLAARTPTTGRGKPLPAAPTMEDTFAKIMNSFESKWEQFIEDKGFSGFMDEYHGRWLHSCVSTHLNPQHCRSRYGRMLTIRCVSGDKKSPSLRPNHTPASASRASRQTTGSSAASRCRPRQPDLVRASRRYMTAATLAGMTG